MCGIAGSFHPEGRTCDENVMVRMRDRMAHRGPDGVGIWASPDRRCTLGSPAAVDHRPVGCGGAADVEPRRHGDADLQRRDLQPRRAPPRAARRSASTQWKTDHSDTEVLLHAYEEWGLDFVQRFYGMFAVGIYDARDPGRPVLHLIRDRVGIKPLYFTRTARRRVAVRVGDPRDRRPPRHLARDGSDRLLALPHVHRRAGAADDVPRHLQAAGRPRPDDRPHAARRGAPVLGLRARIARPRCSRARHQRAGSGRRADPPAEAVDRPAHGVGRAVRRAAVGRRRFVDERGADERADGSRRSRRSPSATRGRKTTTSSSTRGASASATRPIITRR